MKKTKTYAILLILILSLVIGNPIPVYATNTNDSVIYATATDFQIDVSKLVNSQKAGDVAFHTLNKILSEDTEKSTPLYSDFISKYAGSSIDDDGNLIIYITENFYAKNDQHAQLNTLKVSSNSIQYIQVTHSYDELKSYQNIMWEVRNQALTNPTNANLYTWAEKINSVAINPINNSVIILAHNFTTQDYELCNTLFGEYPYEVDTTMTDSKCIEEIVELRPGTPISNRGISMGYRCTLNGVKGFVTTIHSENFANQNIVEFGGIQVGEIVESVYDGIADFTFVKITNSNYEAQTTTNTTPAFTLHNINYVVSLPIGATVYMAGRNSTTVRQGQVVYYDYAISNGTNWLIADYQSAGGDSGGCVFAGINGDYCVIGIHNGSINVDSDSDYEKYITKHTTIKTYFDIRIY